MNDNLCTTLIILIIFLTIFSSFYLIFHENYYQSPLETCFEECESLETIPTLQCKESCMKIFNNCDKKEELKE